MANKTLFALMFLCSYALLRSRHLYNCREVSTNHAFFNKQSQFPGYSNERKLTNNKDLSKFYPAGGAKKQTQFKPNSNPITERVKLMQSVYLQRIMKKNAAKGYEKQTQNKPNSNPNKACPERIYTELRRSSRMGQFPKCQNERKIGCIHISKKYNALIRKVLDSQTYFVVKNRLY